MLIRVVYRNERYDFVKPRVLDKLISERRIKQFLRSDGWSNTTTDRIRGTGGDYRGIERRRPH